MSENPDTSPSPIERKRLEYRDLLRRARGYSARLRRLDVALASNPNPQLALLLLDSRNQLVNSMEALEGKLRRAGEAAPYAETVSPAEDP